MAVTGHTHRASWIILLAIAGCSSPSGNETGPVGESYLHVRPSWSPDGRSIAFRATIKNVGGIYLVDPSGSNLRLLIEGEGIGTAWSPDSKWLAFSSVGSLYKIKANGDSLTRLTSSAGDIRPAWSPDGGKVCFVRRDQLGSQAVWIYDVRSGSSSQFLTYGDYPSWHPTGNAIIILEAQFDAPANAWVYRFTSVALDMSSVRTLATLTTKSDCGFTSMNPGGDAIAYSLKPTDDYAQVWKFELSAARHTRLTDDGGDHPSWSPNGSRIVYTRTHSGDGGLWVMNADGTGKHRLTTP